MRSSPQWSLWNRQLLKLWGPLLIVIGALGFVVPAEYALTSGAPAYNLFHLAFGLLGTLLAFRGSPGSAATFNLGFGAIDLYQAAAAYQGWFPSQLIGYLAADNIAHVLLGAGLATLGAAGLFARGDSSRLSPTL